MVKTRMLKKAMVLQVLLLFVIMTPMTEATILIIDSGQHTMQVGDVYDRVSVRESSHLDITGGVINQILQISSNASVVMTDGLIQGEIDYRSISHMDIHGGTVNGKIRSSWGQFNIFGGAITGPIEARSLAEVIIYGNSFMIGGQSVSGTLDLDYLTSIGALTMIIDAERAIWSGSLTGNLQDGSPLDINIEINRLQPSPDTANFTLIPEPVSLVLLALGSLLMRRKMTT